MNYQLADSVTQALSLLAAGDGGARIIAGGTDLLLDVEDGKYQPQTAVDVSNIAELKEIRIDGEYLSIGSAVTHAMAAGSQLVQEYAPALAQACRSVGSLQIRNVATLAGNVANAQPAADGAIALAALGASCLVAESDGSRREIALADMYRGVGRSAVDSTRQLIVAIRLPLQQPGEASSFVRLELRRALALPMLNMAAMVRVEQGVVAWARIAMGPVGPGPVRAAAAENMLTGKELSEDNILMASSLVLREADPRSNPLRGSREYRLMTLPVLAARALREIAAKLARA